jgi:hypothetical protein
VVVSSEAALQRTEATISNARPRDAEAIDTPRLHWQANRVESPNAAQAALDTLAPAWTDHPVEACSLMDHNRDAGQGRPTPTTPMQAVAWPMQAQVRPDDEPLGPPTHLQACVGVGTTLDTSQWSDAEVMRAYQGQAQAEGGVRCLTEPRCCVASLVGKQPGRVHGLLLVMT